MTDDKVALKEQLEAVTGERIAALEAVEPEWVKEREAGLDAAGRSSGGDETPASQERERSSGSGIEEQHAPKSVDRELAL